MTISGDRGGVPGPSPVEPALRQMRPRDGASAGWRQPIRKQMQSGSPMGKNPHYLTTYSHETKAEVSRHMR